MVWGDGAGSGLNFLTLHLKILKMSACFQLMSLISSSSEGTLLEQRLCRLISASFEVIVGLAQSSPKPSSVPRPILGCLLHRASVSCTGRLSPAPASVSCTGRLSPAPGVCLRDPLTCPCAHGRVLGALNP